MSPLQKGVEVVSIACVFIGITIFVLASIAYMTRSYEARFQHRAQRETRPNVEKSLINRIREGQIVELSTQQEELIISSQKYVESNEAEEVNSLIDDATAL